MKIGIAAHVKPSVLGLSWFLGRKEGFEPFFEPFFGFLQDFEKLIFWTAKVSQYKIEVKAYLEQKYYFLLFCDTNYDKVVKKR